MFPLKSQPKVLIDISSIEALKDAVPDANLVIGAGTTLTELMGIFQRWSTKSDFSYLAELYKHLDLVAHVPVRNVSNF